jgi:uncharacterized protein (TIGR02271 family)
VLIPLEGVRVEPGGDPVDLPFDGARLAGAPQAEPTVTSLDAATAQAVTAHFAGESPTQVAAPVDDDAPEMVLSEEQLLVETERVPVDRVRLRKEIVEEEVTLTVVLRREELVIEREPVGPDEALVEPVAGTETPLEIVLWAEEPVVTTRSVPTERVRLRREVVTEDREITRELKRERAEVDHPTQETSSR